MVEEKRSEKFEQLRKEAERKLDEAMEKTDISEEETLSIKELIHELQVHQIELELQNQELRETKARLQRSKEKYTDLYDSAPISYLTLDEDGKIVSANLTAAEKLGTDLRDLKDEKLYRFVREDHRDRLYKHLRKAFRTEKPQSCELKMITASQKDLEEKEEFYGLMKSNVYADEEDNLLCRTALIDITERKEAKERMRKSEERYRRLFETAQDGILIIDAGSGKIIDGNPFIKEMLGYSLKELKGKHLWEVGTFKDIAENRERFADLRENEYVRYENLPLETKDGEKISVEFVSNIYEVGDEEVIQCNIRDITARKKAEDREQFLHSLLRHDVKNKSQIVKGYLGLLRDHDLSEESLEYIEKAYRATQEGIDIIDKVKRLREIEKQDESRVMNIDMVLNKAVSEHEGELEEKDIEIETERCGYEVQAGPLLNELFSNLIENSIKHSGCSMIRIGVTSREEEYIVTVEDDGKGVPDDKKEKIFEKGYKKGDDAGSGLGLFIVNEIAEGYEGGVELKDSELGGARFDVHLRKVED